MEPKQTPEYPGMTLVEIRLVPFSVTSSIA